MDQGETRLAKFVRQRTNDVRCRGNAPLATAIQTKGSATGETLQKAAEKATCGRPEGGATPLNAGKFDDGGVKIITSEKQLVVDKGP